MDRDDHSIKFISEWRSAVVGKHASLHFAMETINNSGLQVALIIDDHQKLLGVLTDGDIRRAILDGHNLNTSLSEITLHKFISTQSYSTDVIYELMLRNKVHHVPIVDSEGVVCGLSIFHDSIRSSESINNTMIIMAGGFGRRLMPLTENCPKPMLLISGKPMLEHIVLHARAQGFTKFIISVHYLSHLIKDYFGDGSRWQVNISYLEEVSPLGTAGALAELSDSIDLPFIVINGDIISEVNYKQLLKFHEDRLADATMVVSQHEMICPYGVVDIYKDEIVGFTEKPAFISNINAGIYVLNSANLSLLDRDVYCDMPSLFMKIKSAKGKVVAYQMYESWFDVGRFDDLEKVNLRKK